MNVEVCFSTWQRLTALLQSEDDSYDAVIERLIVDSRNRSSDDEHAERRSLGAHHIGAAFKGVFLPEGTRLRATHRGKTYFASISGSRWIDDASGETRTSPSHAASKITGGSLNGWLFWLAKRPGDAEWHSLAALRDAKQDQ